MTKIYMQREYLEDIGEALREANATDKKYLPSEMPVAILDAMTKFAPKNIVSGTVMTISDAEEWKLLGMKMYGKSTQTQYEGNQLLPYPYSTTTGTYGGVLVTDNGDGSLTLNGSSSEDASFYLKAPAPITLSAGTYTLEASGLTEGLKCRLNEIYGTSVFYTGTFTLEEETMFRVSLNILKGYTFNTTVYPMLNAGDTALPWEPYVGGIPSPSPQYPQEIVNAGVLNEDTGKYEIECKVFNKNMFLLDKFIEVASGCSGCEIVTFDGRRCLHVTNVSQLYDKKGTYNQPFAVGQYTLQYDVYVVSMSEYDGIGFSIQYETGVETYILPKPGQALNAWSKMCGTSATGYKCERLVLSYGGQSECYIDLDSIQLEAGTEATTYEPYTEQTLSIPYVLCEGDNVSYADKKITRKSKIRKLAGMPFTKGNPNNEGTGTTFYIECNEDNIQDAAGTFSLCTHLKWNRYYTTWGNLKVNEYFLAIDGLILCTPHDTVDDLTAWLEAENVEVIYSTTDPITTLLTEEELNQFKALHMNYPSTTIMNNAGCYTEVTYLPKINESEEE